MRRNRSRRNARSGRDAHIEGRDERVGGEGGAGGGMCMAQFRNIGCYFPTFMRSMSPLTVWQTHILL